MDAQWRIQGGCIPISRSLQKIIILHSGIHHKNPIQEVYYLYLAMRLNSLTALNISKNILRDLYAVILGCWRCLICPQLLIRSITWRSYVILRCLTVSATLFTIGLHHTWVVAGSTFEADLQGRSLPYCRAVWSTTRVGPWSDPFPVVHGRPTWTSGDTRVITTSLYWWLTNI